MHDLLSLASDSGSEEVFCLLRTTLLPPSPAGGWPVAPGVTGTPGANRKIKWLHWKYKLCTLINQTDTHLTAIELTKLTYSVIYLDWNLQSTRCQCKSLPEIHLCAEMWAHSSFSDFFLSLHTCMYVCTVQCMLARYCNMTWNDKQGYKYSHVTV